jgi:hypothetical protein
MGVVHLFVLCSHFYCSREILSALCQIFELSTCASAAGCDTGHMCFCAVLHVLIRPGYKEDVLENFIFGLL